jgi:hypothetical protein
MFERWLKEGTLLPPRIENLLGPVWGHALGLGIKAVNAQKRMTSRLATTTIGGMLVESAELVRKDLEDEVLEVPTRRVVAALHAGASGGPELDVVRLAARVFFKVLFMDYCSKAERDVFRAAMPYVPVGELVGAFDRKTAPEVSGWAQVVEDLQGRGIEITENNARQRWHAVWQKILGDAPYLRALHRKLQDAEHTEDPDQYWQRFQDFPKGFSEWISEPRWARSCPEGWVPCHWCGKLLQNADGFCGERCQKFYDRHRQRHRADRYDDVFKVLPEPT